MKTISVPVKEHDYSFDFLRTVAMLGVILYHAAGAYSYLSPYWPVQDQQGLIGNGLRGLLVVFIMPFFFFIAGFFTLPSIREKSIPQFSWHKFKRLGSYWVFIVLIVIPFFAWKQRQLSGNYFEYWFNDLVNFNDIRIGPLTSLKYNHMHYWFISLLFYVFILFALFDKIRSGVHEKKALVAEKAYKRMTPSDLLILGLITVTADYIFIGLFPDSSWIVIPKVFQGNINQLPILLLFFCFGVYARYRKWFMKEDVPGKPIFWIFVSLLLTVLYFIIGPYLFDNIDISNSLSAHYLLSFSFVRSFLLVSYLMMFLSFAVRHFRHRNPFLNRIADVSYEIYLVHMFIVGGFQMLFLRYASIPVGIKIVAVFMIATLISYFFGKYTLKKFPKISGSVLFILFFGLMVLYNR